MRAAFRFCLLLLLVAGTLWSQTPNTPGQPSQKAAAPGASKSTPADSPPGSRTPIAPSTAVITIAGLCDKGSSQVNCNTEITREEFERLAQVVQPGMSSTQRQRFAALYSQWLVFAEAAQKRGLDKSAEGQEALRFAQVQALSQVLARQLQADASKLGADDVQKYYHEHPKQFEEGNLLRLYVPRGQQADGKTVNEEDAQGEMKKLRERAAKGEPLEPLQKQAYSDLGVAGTPPPTELKKVRREGLNSAMAAVFDLPLSTLSDPISEPNGLYVLELTAKRVLSAQEAGPEIANQLQNRRVQQALQEISGSTKTTFNAQYFGGAPNIASTGPDTDHGSSTARGPAAPKGSSSNPSSQQVPR